MAIGSNIIFKLCLGMSELNTWTGESCRGEMANI